MFVGRVNVIQDDRGVVAIFQGEYMTIDSGPPRVPMEVVSIPERKVETGFDSLQVKSILAGREMCWKRDVVADWRC